MKWLSLLLDYILCKICRRRIFKPGIVNEEIVKQIKPKAVQPKLKSFEIEQHGLGIHLFECMKEHGTKVAQIDALSGEVDQYCSLLRRSVRTAIELIKRGFETYDIICVYAENNLDTVVPFIAATFIGARITTLDPQLGYQEFSYLIMQLKPKFIFIDRNNEIYIKRLLFMSNLITEVIVFGEPTTNKFSRFSDFVRPKENEINFQPYETININSVALIVFTTGTTGVPRGVNFSHKFVLYTSKNIQLSIYLQHASLYNFAAILAVISILSSGGCRIVCSDFRPQFMWGYIASYGVLDLMMSPYEAILLLDYIPPHFHCDLQNIQIYGAIFPEVLAEQYRQLFPNANVCSIYGLTELGFTFQSINPNQSNYKDKLKSVGTVLHNFHYKIVDLNSEILLGPDEIGELRIKCPIRATYFDVELNSGAYDKDDFFKTGDVAYFDSDFNFYILDRSQDIFLKNHVTLLPSVIENVILMHEGVELVCAYGCPGENCYDITVAVVLKQNVILSPKELGHFANEKLPKDYKVKAVKIVDMLPVTPTGTVRRLSLLEEEEVNRHKKVSILFFTT